jgi:hypothetical protein
MQIICCRIPYQGTEFSSRETRAGQASREIARVAKTELDALKQLTEAECSSAPTLLNHKQEKQTDDMLVPQGYILYILMNRLPGVPLGKFWLMNEAERHDIREAFKVAYEYVISVS